MKNYCYKSLFVLFFLFFLSLTSNAQTYSDYIGAGHNVGVKTSSSGTVNNSGINASENSANGTGYLHDLNNSSRFLAQATFGGTHEEIEELFNMGVDEWLENQFNITPISFLSHYSDVKDKATERWFSNEPYIGGEVLHHEDYLRYVFWEKVMTQDDQLRQKVAYALSQIFVISFAEDRIKNHANGFADYYDKFYLGAFGDFKKLLEEVTLHPLMGAYLSTLNNPKTEGKRKPDENFAREIMQLFTIGLVELNIDGTPKLDGDGRYIETYDNDDIEQLAKVFTGLSGGAKSTEKNPNSPLRFGLMIGEYDTTIRMKMYQEYHEEGAKRFLDGKEINSPNDGMAEVKEAINQLFNHDNVGPFIGYRLIQHLVKSNPSPAYVKRVAMVFNDNGKRKRGDMKAVIRAILTDPEARNCDINSDPKLGRLRSPLERFVHLYRVFKAQAKNDNDYKYWFKHHLLNNMEHEWMESKSVFNFYTPFYAENDVVKKHDMVSPEFQLLNSVTAINYINYLQQVIFFQTSFFNYSNSKVKTGISKDKLKMFGKDTTNMVIFTFDNEIKILEENGVESLMNSLNTKLCHGQLSERSTQLILKVLKSRYDDNGNIISGYDRIKTSQDIVEIAIFFIMISPDYLILK